MFPYLDAYLKLPAADRSRFRLAYYFRSNGKPLTAPAWLVDGAQRQPLAVRPDGRVESDPRPWRSWRVARRSESWRRRTRRWWGSRTSFSACGKTMTGPSKRWSK